MKNEKINGMFNVGTGEARSYNDLARSVFEAMNLKENIKYIDVPEELKEKYQYHTQADITKLRKAGYKKKFYTLEEGAKDYVCEYLEKNRFT